MEIYTIGHAKKTAEGFFGLLKSAGIRALVDTRLRSGSQLSGFAKYPDIQYFLKELGGIAYRPEPLLAPTAEILDAYRSKQLHWPAYAERFLALLAERHVAEVLLPSDFAEPTVLLCSEASPAKCHRRLAAEHLAANWPDVRVVHL